MPRARKTSAEGTAPAAPPAAPPESGPRVAVTLAEATDIGLFGVEVDATDDSAYSSVSSAVPGGAYGFPGVIPAPKETTK